MHIPNDELRLSEMPSKTAPIAVVHEFAMTFNGYEYFRDARWERRDAFRKQWHEARELPTPLPISVPGSSSRSDANASSTLTGIFGRQGLRCRPQPTPERVEQDEFKRTIYSRIREMVASARPSS